MDYTMRLGGKSIASVNERTRLYKDPSYTIRAVKAIVGGNDTDEGLADSMGVSPNSVPNYTHDPRALGLIGKRDGVYQATDKAKRLVQLQDDSVLRDPFLQLNGVGTITERLQEEGTISFEQLGRIIAFETGSNATEEGTFRDYGRVYASWFDHLELGHKAEQKLFESEDIADEQASIENQLKNPHGPLHPKVTPDAVLEALTYLDEIESRDVLADEIDHTERWVAKILGSCYALQLAEPDPPAGFRLTDRGKSIRTASKGQKTAVLRDLFLEIPLVRAFCNRIPDGEFTTGEVMKQVSEDYGQGWSEGTIRTKSKRLYSWLIYTDLAREVKQGTLEPTDRLRDTEIPDVQ
jgi:hypothetical protein